MPGYLTDWQVYPGSRWSANVTRNHSLQAAVIRKGSGVGHDELNLEQQLCGGAIWRSQRVQAPAESGHRATAWPTCEIPSQWLWVGIIANLAGWPFMSRVN
ncbi:hypothetical protein [Cupriavidus sp. CP313]